MTDGRRKVSFKVSVQAIKQSSEATRPAAAAGRANFFGPERAPLDLASFAWSIVSRAKERTFCNLRTLNVINKSCSRKGKKRSRLAFFSNWRADYYGATIFTYRLCGRKEAPSFASTKLSYESLMTRERERSWRIDRCEPTAIKACPTRLLLLPIWPDQRALVISISSEWCNSQRCSRTHTCVRNMSLTSFSKWMMRLKSWQVASPRGGLRVGFKKCPVHY